MTKKKEAGSELVIQVGLDEELQERLDRHLEKLVAGIPGATITRAGWVKAIITRELEGTKAAKVPAGPWAQGDTDRGQLGQGRGD